MFKWKKAAATLLAAAVTGSFVACGESTANAMTIDGIQIKAGMYIYYSYNAYLQLTQDLKAQNSELDVTDNKVVKEQKMDGVSAETWIQNKALEYCKQYAAVEKKADELGIELKSDDKKDINDKVETFWDNSGEIYEKNGISKESVKAILENTYLTDEVFMHYYEVDGEEGVTEDGLKEFYEENNARVQYIQFDLKDGNGDDLDDAGKADMKKMVEDYLGEVQALKGDEDAMEDKMDDIQTEYNAYVTSISEEAAAETATSATDADGNEIAATTTEAAETTAAAETTTTAAAEDSAAETTTAGEESAETTAAEESSSDETTTTTGNDTAETTAEAETTESGATTTTTAPYANEKIIAKVTTDSDTKEEDVTYTPSKKAYDFIFNDAELGVPAMVEDDNAYYIILRRDIKERMTDDDLWTEDNINSVIYTEYQKDFEDMRDKWCDDLNVEKNDRAIKRYDAFKIDMNSSSASN